MELITSWERKGRAEGLREGRAEGLREGRAEGLREGQRLVVERMLTRRFGALPLLTGVGFWGSPFVPSLVLGFRTPKSPFQPLVGEGGREEAHRGRFFGKPLRAISRFSHQDTQTPPSPLVGEGGWGDEGQRRTGMQNIAHLSQKLYT